MPDFKEPTKRVKVISKSEKLQDEAYLVLRLERKMRQKKATIERIEPLDTRKLDRLYYATSLAQGTAQIKLLYKIIDVYLSSTFKVPGGGYKMAFEWTLQLPNKPEEKHVIFHHYKTEPPIFKNYKIRTGHGRVLNWHTVLRNMVSGNVDKEGRLVSDGDVDIGGPVVSDGDIGMGSPFVSDGDIGMGGSIVSDGDINAGGP